MCMKCLDERVFADILTHQFRSLTTQARPAAGGIGQEDNHYHLF